MIGIDIYNFNEQIAIANGVITTRKGLLGFVKSNVDSKENKICSIAYAMDGGVLYKVIYRYTKTNPVDVANKDSILDVNASMQAAKSTESIITTMKNFLLYRNNQEFIYYHSLLYNLEETNSRAISQNDWNYIFDFVSRQGQEKFRLIFQSKVIPMEKLVVNRDCGSYFEVSYVNNNKVCTDVIYKAYYNLNFVK